MPSNRPESLLSEAARDFKSATRVLAVLAALMGGGVIASLKGWIPRPLSGPFIGFFAAATLGTIWMGRKAHARALEDREKEGSRFMIIAIAGQLAKQDDASLERIQARGGPAGEAAAMLLIGRAEKRGREVERSRARPNGESGAQSPHRPLDPSAS